MRIGIDASCWHNNRGFGRFTRELLSAMLMQPRNHQFLIFSDDDDVEDLEKLGAEIVKIDVGRRVIDAAIAKDQRSIGDILSFTRAAQRQKLDLLFYPAVYSWFPTPPGVPSIVTFNDAIAEHFPDLVFPGARDRVMWNLKCWLAKKSCTKILPVSQSAKSEIINYLKIPAQKIDVICEERTVFLRNLPTQKFYVQRAINTNCHCNPDCCVMLAALRPIKIFPGSSMPLRLRSAHLVAQIYNWL